MITKEKISDFFKNLGKVLLHLSKITVVCIILLVGFMVGRMYSKYVNRTSVTEMQRSKTLRETSVAINERGELLVIDRQYGTYQVFQDSVGEMIFNLYATKVYSTQHSK